MTTQKNLMQRRNEDKNRETELCQTIIDACEQLDTIAQERCDGEYERFWSLLSEMALRGPQPNDFTEPGYERFGFWRSVAWVVYNRAFKVFGKTKVWPKIGKSIWR